MAKVFKDASLRYQAEGIWYHQDILVNELKQEHSMKINSSQSRVSQQHYPLSYSPGDMVVSGQCRSQIEYQKLALFIRTHHQVIINKSGAYFRKGQTGFPLLLRLRVSSEGIDLSGLIGAFQISKKGYFDPAPKYSFNLIQLYDNNGFNPDYSISQEIVSAFDPPTVPVSLPDGDEFPLDSAYQNDHSHDRPGRGD